MVVVEYVEDIKEEMNVFFGTESWNFDDLFREFSEMRNEMERAFSDSFKNIEDRIPKSLVKEYEASEREKVREVGPMVYGYSMTIGPDGKPNIREFGNMKSPFAGENFTINNNHQFLQKENR